MNHLLEQAKLQETERKTLVEIQQEQEFAKWWEEESKRVQEEMQRLEVADTKKKKRRKYIAKTAKNIENQ